MLAAQSPEAPVLAPIQDRARTGSDASLYLLGAITDASKSAEVIRKIRPDILIVDLRLAGRAGLETMRHLDSDLLDIPTIVMTDIATTTLREQCLRLGARFVFDEVQDFEQLRAAAAVLIRNGISRTGRLV